MAAVIHRLRTPRDRIRQDQNAELTQALLPFLDDPDLDPRLARLVSEVKGLVDRRTASLNKWAFVMLSPDQNAAVVEFLASNAARPLVCMRLWALCFRHLRTDTGEIMLSRDQMADALAVPSGEVSRCMSELVKFGAISRVRERVPGLRGAGLARYFMNPNVATHLSGKVRDDAQRSAPVLALVGGSSGEIRRHHDARPIPVL